MALETLPKIPAKGTASEYVVACFQSTWPDKTGMNPDKKASPAESVASGIARRTTARIPKKFTPVKKRTRQLAKMGTDTPGRYHALIALAATNAVAEQ